MITTITLNPAIDKMIEVEHVELGSVHRVKNLIKALGGKSINVSRVLTGLNIENEGLCFAGSKNLDEIMSYAGKDDLLLDPIEVEGFTRTNVKLIESKENYRTTDINEPGFVVSPEKLEDMLAKIKEKATNSDYIVLSGSLPAGLSKDIYGRIAAELKDVTNVVIDADGEVLNEGLKGAPFLIKPNVHELEAALMRKLETHEDIIKAAQDMIAEYGITYILVSMGEEGSILVSKDLAFKADILSLKVVNTVGAGDSMLAGFLYGLSKYGDLAESERLKKALSCGVGSSAIAISTQNHLTFTEDRLAEQAEQVVIHQK